MSSSATAWAWKQRIGNAGVKPTLLALAEFADESGFCYPSQDTLAEMTEQSSRTIRRHLIVLEKMSLIRREKRRHEDGTRATDGFFLLASLDDLRLGKMYRKHPKQADKMSTGQPDTVSAGSSGHPRSEPVDTAVSYELSLEPINPPLSPQSQQTGCTVPSDGSAAEETDEEADRRLAQWMLDRIRLLNPQHGEPNWRRWCREIRLLRERDHRTRREICQLFAWANNDRFWQTNILSPGKLRQQWDTLVLKRGVAGRPAGAGGAAHSTDYSCVGVGDGSTCGKPGTRSLGLSNQWVCEACFRVREQAEIAAHG